MLDINKLRADAVSISVRASISDAETDDLAVELTSRLIDHDEAIGAAFSDAIEAPIYQRSKPDFTHLVPIAADFLAPRFGTTPAITIKQLAADCFTLAVMKARGEA